MVFIISFSALLACYNFAVIKSYKVGYDKGYKDLWHYLQAVMVLLVVVYHSTDWKDFISYGIVYYVIFESLLNLLRQKHVFYVSKDGSFSDKIRSKLYGKHPHIKEGIIKTILIFTALWLKFY